MIVYSANDVLTFAKDLKRRRHRFYAVASARANDEGARALLDRLAAEAQQQLLTTALLHRQFSSGGEHSLFDTAGEAGVVLEAMARGPFLDYRIDPRVTLTGTETAEQVSDIAAGLAENTLIFYEAVKEMVAVEGGREQISLLIETENRHLRETQALLGLTDAPVEALESPPLRLAA